MKRLDRTLSYHNLYVEGFALCLLVLCLNVPFCIILFIGYMVWQRKTMRWELFSLLMIILVGRFFLFSMNQDLKEIHDKVKIVQIDTFETSKRLTVKYLNHQYHIYVYQDDYALGDVLLVDGKIEAYLSETIPDGFNRYQYYQSLNVLGVIQTDELEKLSSGFSIFSWRQTLMDQVKTSHDIFAKAFVFGSDISAEESELFGHVNLLFLIQTTGLHAYMLVLIIKKMMFYFDVKDRMQHSVVITIYGILCYLNGFALGVVRLLFFQIFNVINQRYQLRLTPLDRLFIVCFVMILISFSWVYSTGFLMTFLILLTLELARDRYQKKRGYMKRLIMSILIVFACLPFMRYINPLVTLVLPILISFVTIILYPLSFVACFTSRLDLIYGFMIDLFTQTIGFLDMKSFAYYLPALSEWQILLYYVLFAFMLYAYRKRELILRTIVLMSLFGFKITSNRYLNDASVYFLDVGQGDTTYIETRSCSAMIDSFYGSTDFLKNRGIYQLDYLFLTHSDRDHTLEAASIIHDIGVNQVIVNPFDDGYEAYQSPVINSFAGQSYPCGDLVFDILGPLRAYDEPNENSLVIAVTIHQDRYLFTGDISKTVEADLVQYYGHALKSDILKIAHHGSNTSSSDLFIKTVMPTDAIIMAGRHNHFGFPHQETLDTFYQYDINIHRTDKLGSIMITYQEVDQLWETTLPISYEF